MTVDDDNEANRQLSETAFYSRVYRDLTPTHQNTISNTIHTFIANGDLPHTAKNLISITPRTPVMYVLPKIHKPNNPGRPIVSACGCPTAKQIFNNTLIPHLITFVEMTVLAQHHHVLVANWNYLLTMLIISIQHSFLHGRSARPARPMYHS